MPDADHFVRAGDLAQPLRTTLRDADGERVDISGRDVTVTAVPLTGGDALLDAATAANDQAAAGTEGDASYEWQATETDDAGFYLVSWTVAYDDDEPLTYPNAGYELLHITAAAPETAGRLYLTAEELKKTLRLDGTTLGDEDIPAALEAASRAIDEICERRFWADADVNQIRYYTPDRPHTLDIDDLITLTALAADRAGDGTFGETWTANTDFVLEPLNAVADGRSFDTVRLRKASSRSFPCYERSVRVTGKFGWAEVPGGVKVAAKIIATRLIQRPKAAPFGVLGFTGPDGTAVRIARSDPDVLNALEPYIRMRPVVAGG